MVVPAFSIDGGLVATTVDDGFVQILVIHDRVISAALPLPSNHNLPILQLQWSPTCLESQVHTLLAVTAHRIVVFDIQVQEIPKLVRIAADVEFPQSYGKICATEFIFDHDALMVIFEHFSAASIMSLRSSKREDVPNRKFAGPQSFATRFEAGAQQSVVALTLREKHADQVAVLQNHEVVACFNTDTVDLQMVKWLPDHSPVLMAIDAASHGAKVLFYTASGQALRQLTISPELADFPSISPGFAGLGVLHVDCARAESLGYACCLAFSMGHGVVLVRKLNPKALSAMDRFLENPCTATTETTSNWTQVGHDTYLNEAPQLEAEPANPSFRGKLWLSPDASKLVTCSQRGTDLAVWDLQNHSVTATLRLEENLIGCFWIRDSTGLVLVTSDDQAGFYYWPDFRHSPQRKVVTRLASTVSKSWKAQLVHVNHKEGMQTLLAISSSHNFDIVEIGSRSCCSIFDRASQTQDSNEHAGSFLLEDTLLQTGTEKDEMSSSEHGSSIFF